jgi:hypothetical protein
MDPMWMTPPVPRGYEKVHIAPLKRPFMVQKDAEHQDLAK